ncbi:hypothetical protein JK358_28065 [Nocardia sp. 2]|uniref:ribose-phosphate diphosphokinase n=1 Tax=Nocardia acididurans TaxID=2802282 RepID=A0ABS1MDY9_9NOCA|nr:phosphoribosyltransferase family protein [Nocardia acididurans]MBL1078270.1 hypothetical protein [Nocardia acididurans]
MIEAMVRTASGARPDEVEFMRFPGGEWFVKPGPEFDPSAARFAVVRGGTPDDLLALGMWADLVRHHGQAVRVLMPYLPAARTDRDVPCGAKVYATLINAFADELVYADIHSPLAERQLSGPKTAEIPLGTLASAVLPGDYDLVIAPDAGARHRAEAVAAALGGLPVGYGRKRRDPATGRLGGFEFDPALVAGRRAVVVDDVCDGGGTFAGLAAAADFSAADRVDLWVTHGVFSGGPRLAANLAPYARVYTTDSHPGALAAVANSDRITVVNLVEHVLTQGIL